MHESPITLAIDKADFVGLTLFKCKSGWQASIQTESGGGWNVRIENTPSEALATVLGFEPIPAIIPPPC